MGLFTTLAIAAGIGAAVGITVPKLLGGKEGKSQESAPLPMPQAPKVEDVSDRAADIIKRKRAAMSQSIYTSPLGVAGQATVARKSLLGQ